MASAKWVSASAFSAMAISLGTGVASAQSAEGQGAPATSASREAGQGGVQDIVVTARRRAESLQSTPIAVTALNADMINSRGIVDLGDVSRIAPNTQIMQNTGVLGASSASIRGIGYVDNVLGQDSPIGIYIDGVANGRLNTALMDLVEPDSIQVLRGPQGTLFGRNTTAGAIIIETHTPTDEFSGRVRASYGTFNLRQVSTRVDTGMLGGTGLKASFAFSSRNRDGTQNSRNLPSSQDPGSEESTSYFGKLAGEWGNFKATLSGDYSKLRGNPEVLQLVAAIPALVQYNNNSPNFGGTTVPIVNRPLYTQDNSLYREQRVAAKGLALTLEYDVIPELTLKSITGFRSYRRNDPTAVGSIIKGPTTAGTIGTFEGFFATPQRSQEQRQKSEELQALGTIGDFDYVLGLYYFKENGSDFAETRLPFVVNGSLASVVDTFREYDVVSKSKAAFGQVSWKPAFLDRKLELTGGIRYTKDTRDFDQTRAIVRQVDLETGNTSYLLSASYQWTPGILTYAKYSTAYRAGGFSVRSPANVDPRFQPEYIKSTEVGFKIDALDRRLRLNVAAFDSKYDDLQVVVFAAPTGADAGGQQNVNANARFKGFEVEATAVPVDGLTFTGTFGYIDAKYKNFPQPLNAGRLTPGCQPINLASGALFAQDCAAVADVTEVPKTTLQLGAS